MTDWNLVAGAMARNRKGKSMWQKIVWQILKIGMANVPWEAIAKGLLIIVRKKVKEANITLDDLIESPTDLLEEAELFFAKTLGVEWDITGDGHIGPAE